MSDDFDEIMRFDEMMRAAFPPTPLPDSHILRMESMSKRDRDIHRTLTDIDDMLCDLCDRVAVISDIDAILCDLRDRIAEMRAGLGDRDE